MSTKALLHACDTQVPGTIEVDTEPKIVMDHVVLVMALAVDVVSIDTAIHTGPINHHSGAPSARDLIC